MLINIRVEKIDSLRYIYYSSNSSARFDYINFRRVFELFLTYKTPFKDIPMFKELNNLRILNNVGTLNEPNSWKTTKPRDYLLETESGYLVNFYMKIVLGRIIPELNLKDITNLTKSKEGIMSKLNQGDFFYGQLGFHFKDIANKNTGRNQIRKARFDNKIINIEFVFDAWECTSFSSRMDSLRNRKVTTPILHLKSMEVRNNILFLNVSCLAIGFAFKNMKSDRKNPKDYA